MTELVAVEPNNHIAAFALIERQAGILAKCRGMVPDQFAGKPNEIIAAGMFGQSLGLDLIIALQTISVINGKPSLDASGWSALIRKAGHSIECTEHTNTVCTLKGTRKDNGDTFTSTFTWEDATAARLTGKDTWKKHPKDMLFARALTGLGRRLFSDIAVGGMYTPDELQTDTQRPVETVTATIATHADTSTVADGTPSATEISVVCDEWSELPEEQATKIAVFVQKRTDLDLANFDDWAQLDPFWVAKISELVGRATSSVTGGGSIPSVDPPPDPTYDKPFDPHLEQIPEYVNGQEPF